MRYTVLKVQLIISNQIFESLKKIPILYCVYKERREIYFIAIIDVLTQYGVKKQVKSNWLEFWGKKFY